MKYEGKYEGRVLKTQLLTLFAKRKFRKDTLVYGNKPSQYEKDKMTPRKCGERIQVEIQGIDTDTNGLTPFLIDRINSINGNFELVYYFRSSKL